MVILLPTNDPTNNGINWIWMSKKIGLYTVFSCLGDKKLCLSFLLQYGRTTEINDFFGLFMQIPKCNVAPEHVCCILNIRSHLRLPKGTKIHSKLKPDISSNNSQLAVRLLNCFVLKTSVYKTIQLRSLIAIQLQYARHHNLLLITKRSCILTIHKDRIF